MSDLKKVNGGLCHARMTHIRHSDRFAECYAAGNVGPTRRLSLRMSLLSRLCFTGRGPDLI